jgi:hypothetical protein
MSGFEIVVGIAGIVSAIVGVKNLISKAIASRKAKKLAIRANEQIAEQQLMKTLQESPNQIYEEFRKDLARVGGVFAKGDGNRLTSRLC